MLKQFWWICIWIKKALMFCYYILDKVFSIRLVQGAITCPREFLKSGFQQTDCILLFPPALCRHMFCVNAFCSKKWDHTKAEHLAWKVKISVVREDKQPQEIELPLSSINSTGWAAQTLADWVFLSRCWIATSWS